MALFKRNRFYTMRDIQNENIFKYREQLNNKNISLNRDLDKKLLTGNSNP